MPRYKLMIEYDGTAFSGWQRQVNGRSVQQAVEEAIEAFAGRAATIETAEPTAAGVHAIRQVAHVDFCKDWSTDIVRDAVNAHLRPEPVSILEAETVPDSFDARTSARKRHYLYRILNRQAPPGLDVNRVWHVSWALDPLAIQAAAQTLVGHRDFTTFRAAECKADSPVRTLDRLDVSAHGEEIRIVASACSFLHNQVRSMVGSIVLAGAGQWSVRAVRQALEAKDRTRCGPPAPACGLYLTRLDY